MTLLDLVIVSRLEDISLLELMLSNPKSWSYEDIKEVMPLLIVSKIMQVFFPKDKNLFKIKVY